MKEQTQVLLAAVTTTGASAIFSTSQTIQSYQATLANTSTPTATLVIQASNDQTSWVDVATLSPAAALDSKGTTIESAYAFMRVNCTAIAGASAALTVSVAY